MRLHPLPMWERLVSLEYVRDYYGVPAEIGRRVTVYGRPGIIGADCGHYIGVNFDDAPPGMYAAAHPTDGVVYGEMGKERPLTRAQKRYRAYLEVADLYDDFAHYLRTRRADPREAPR